MEIIEYNSERVPEQIVRADEVRIRFAHTPKRYYRHGWQSWSLAAWTDAGLHLPVQKPYLLHSMQGDPAYSFHARPNGSWVGAVETAGGETVLLGSLGLDAHVELQDHQLIGRYEAGEGDWLVTHGDETSVFARYAEELGKRLGKRSAKAAPRIWCSWYGLYAGIEERQLLRIFDGLQGLPFDVLQVDDGWQCAVGDWEANNKFPAGMATLADKIKATGRRAGLWLAPLLAVRSARLFRTHPDWFLHDKAGRLVSAGFNWGQPLYALDTTHPMALEWLRELMKQVRSWGYDYVKLDFLYAGALPGKRHEDVPREAAYRRGLQVLRDAMGEDAYFLACGAPIIPSIGLCDALRIGPDVAAGWESQRDALLLHNPTIPGVRNAIRTTIQRLWLQPLVQADPDVVYFRSVDCSLTDEQKLLLRSLALICGFKATSDLPQWLSEEEWEQLRRFLEAPTRIEPAGPSRFRVDGQEIDFSTALKLPGAPKGWRMVQSELLGWLGNQAWAMRINHEIEQRTRGRRKGNRAGGRESRG